MVMTYSTAAELKIYARALWTATDEIYLEQLEIYVPLHRAMKFERWVKSNSLDYRITQQSCRVSGKPGYRAFLFTLDENTAGALDKLLAQFKRWGFIITNCHLSQCSDDLDREDLAVIEDEISAEDYSLEMLAKAAKFMDSHPTADINAVLKHLR